MKRAAMVVCFMEKIFLNDPLRIDADAGRDEMIECATSLPDFPKGPRRLKKWTKELYL